MTITDEREKVYRKANGRYVPIGSIDDAFTYDGFKCEGLWLHTRKDGGSTQSMSLIATLSELPSSAASFASVMRHKDELVGVLKHCADCGMSLNDTSANVLEWIAAKGKA